MKEIIGIILFVGLILYFYEKISSYRSDKKYKPSTSNKKHRSKKIEPIAQSFSFPIPKGYQIYINNPAIAGLSYRKEDALKWASADNQDIQLERESGNQHDSNAIKVIGTTKKNNYFLGYLPKELAENLVETETFDIVKARLIRIYVSETGFIDIQYQVIGPKTHKAKLTNFDLEKQKEQDQGPASADQKIYIKFFNLSITKGMKFGDTEKIIKVHRTNASQSEIEEWDNFLQIEEELNDRDVREEYGIKKVSTTLLGKAILELKNQGLLMEELVDDIDVVVEKLIELKPDLKK